MNTLDDICALIVSADSVGAIQKEVIPALRKVDKSSASQPGVLEGALKDGSDPLERLLPETAAVGYLFILNARCSATQPDLAVLLPFINGFTERFDPQQLRLVPEQATFFAKQLVHLANAARNPGLAVLPLKNLVQRITYPGFLTNLHPIFLQAVLSSRLYEHARDVLSESITDVDPNTFPLRYQDHLLYHYLGGVIAALLQDHTRAMDMLEACISAPGPGVSAMQLDAMKKLILVQLLANGKTHPLPKYTSAAVFTAAKNHCGAYTDYAAAYASHDKQKIQTAIERHQDTFAKDFNIGLLRQCDRAFRRRTIQRLTETYITLSLSDIAQAVDLSLDEAGLRESEQELLRMITAGEVHGSIAHPAGADWFGVTVTFTDDPEPFNSHATVARVTKAINFAATFDANMVERGRVIGFSRDFVQKAYNAAASTAQPVGGAGLEDIDMTVDWEGED